MRNNTIKELKELDRARRETPNKRVYFNLKLNRYSGGWCSDILKNIELPRFRLHPVQLHNFYTLKRPHVREISKCDNW